jgi:hypothetical protein
MVRNASLFSVLLAITLSDWIPVRWFSAQVRSLGLLADSPVNCLVMEAPLIDRDFTGSAAARGISVLAVLHPSDGVEKAIRAMENGAAGIVLDGDFAAPARLALREAAQSKSGEVIELRNRLGVELSDPRFVGTCQGLWPSVRMEKSGTSTGPTSIPWINTNTGFLRYVRSSSSAVIWIGNHPPPGSVITVTDYLHAICDAAFSGAHWVIDLDPDFQRRLLAGDAKITAQWKQIGGLLAYFHAHREWLLYKPAGDLGVVLHGPAALLSGSVLDMFASQHVPARPVASNVPPAGPAPAVIVSLEPGAVNRTGSFAPPAGWLFPAPEPAALEVSQAEADALQFAWDLIKSGRLRQNFSARVFNAYAMLSNFVTSPDGRQSLFHLVNYTGFPQEDITVQFPMRWRSVRLYRPEADGCELPLHANADGWSVEIDHIRTIGTLELTK